MTIVTMAHNLHSKSNSNNCALIRLLFHPPTYLQMIFAMQELPGEFTTFDFIPGIPAPFNFGLAILSNQKMLTLWEKLQTVPALLPMLLEGQSFIDAQVMMPLRSPRQIAHTVCVCT